MIWKRTLRKELTTVLQRSNSYKIENDASRFLTLLIMPQPGLKQTKKINRVFTAAWGFSVVALCRLLTVKGFSRCRAQPLGYMDFSSCGFQALEHRLNSFGTPRPRTGFEKPHLHFFSLGSYMVPVSSPGTKYLYKQRQEVQVSLFTICTNSESIFLMTPNTLNTTLLNKSVASFNVDRRTSPPAWVGRDDIIHKVQNNFSLQFMLTDHDKDMEMSKSTDSLQRKGYWTVLQKEYHAMCISMNENENNAFVEEMSSWDGAVLRHQLNFSYNNNNYHNQCNQETYTLPLISYTRKGAQLDCDPYSFLSGPWT
ncbi:hypothetical protein MJG53_018859 [Ovis ammon polii x Ovis aries]|uniref:Uncharacterized protein n=1 Tax=Ovis ammon polii x Ovis aries TaxID=2918886 RepID=A0ACB9U3L1_9CETA|nr:hypothetical protein MJG53_018859 [Ovis ammon polii x Ovis aries]